MKKHILLFSQTGTEVNKIVEYLEETMLNYEPYLIITDNQAYNIDPRVENRKQTRYISKKRVKDVEFLRYVFGDPKECIITLHGWLNIIPREICEEYEIYNGHPGLITRYPELKGKDPQKRVWENKSKYAIVGCVIHEVIPEVDEGKILSVQELKNNFTTFDDFYYEMRNISITNWREFLRDKFSSTSQFNIGICFATAGKKEDTVLWKSINNLPDDFSKKTYIEYYEYNTQSLQAVYNKFLGNCRRNNTSIALLIHDDVYVNCGDFRARVINASKMFPVFGLAGCTSCTITLPALWHAMSKREEQRGCVAHGTEENYYYTSFGPLPSRVLLLDGLFIGINLDNIPSDIMFDESYPSRFHYYDLDFSLECNKKGVKMGVVDIPVIHRSPGLTNPNAEFYKGQEYFYNKWKNK